MHMVIHVSMHWHACVHLLHIDVLGTNPMVYHEPQIVIMCYILYWITVKQQILNGKTVYTKIDDLNLFTQRWMILIAWCMAN